MDAHASGEATSPRHGQIDIRPSAPQPNQPKGSARVQLDQRHSQAAEPASIGSGPASARAPECQGWKAMVNQGPRTPEDTWQPSADHAPSQRRKAAASPTPRALADTWQASADQTPRQKRKATVSSSPRAVKDTWQPSAGQAPGQGRKETVSPASRAPKAKWQPSTPERKQGKPSKDCAQPRPTTRDTWQAAKHQRRGKPGNRTQRIRGGASRLFHGQPTKADEGGQDASGRQMSARQEDTPAIQGKLEPKATRHGKPGSKLGTTGNPAQPPGAATKSGCARTDGSHSKCHAQKPRQQQIPSAQPSAAHGRTKGQD